MSKAITIVAKNLRYLRRQKHVTQKELAKETNVADIREACHVFANDGCCVCGF